MLNKYAREELERQHYRIIGEHSAVKVCGWTKNMIKGKGGCYKLKFYGIMSNQCMQMTTSMSCANRCTFCWRGYKAPVSKDWKWGVDEPEMILNESIRFHHKLLEGFGGQPEAKTVYQKSKTVKHVALSLTGEPIIYPRINELLKKFDKQGISTFMVTNAQYPEQIRDLLPVTQLYISLDAPEKELLKVVDLPLFDDYWERLLKSLDYLSEKKQRTCIRLTIIKNINDFNPEGYAELITRGSPDFIEVKAYMHVGAARLRLKKENMPRHYEVLEFTNKLIPFLKEYEIVTEHIPSRVIMLAKKKFKISGIWNTWIDFDKWNKLVNTYDELGKGKEPETMQYLTKTPIVGLEDKRPDFANSDSKEVEEMDLE